MTLLLLVLLVPPLRVARSVVAWLLVRITDVIRLLSLKFSVMPFVLSIASIVVVLTVSP